MNTTFYRKKNCEKKSVKLTKKNWINNEYETWFENNILRITARVYYIYNQYFAWILNNYKIKT